MQKSGALNCPLPQTAPTQNMSAYSRLKSPQCLTAAVALRPQLRTQQCRSVSSTHLAKPAISPDNIVSDTILASTGLREQFALLSRTNFWSSLRRPTFASSMTTLRVRHERLALSSPVPVLRRVLFQCHSNSLPKGSRL
jgi:hypothetical protein